MSLRCLVSVVCMALLLGACGSKHADAIKAEVKAPDTSMMTDGLALARAGFLPVLEARRLIETALDSRPRLILNGDRRDKLELGCRTVQKRKVASPQVEGFQLSSRYCDDSSVTMTGEKNGSELFLLTYKEAAPTLESVNAAAAGTPLPFPQTIVISADDLRFVLAPKRDLTERADPEASWMLTVQLVSEDDGKIVYEASGNFIVPRFAVNRGTWVVRGDYKVRLLAVQFVVDKATRKIDSVGGTDARISVVIEGETQKRLGAEGFQRGERFAGKLELDPPGLLKVPASSCEAPSFELKVASNEVKALSFASGAATMGLATSPVGLCSGKEPGFLFLFEGLFFN